jgi:hypothetical protein
MMRGMIIYFSLITAIEALFFEAIGVVVKIGSSLKLNHQKQI